MPNYINPFSYSSIGTTSARSSSNAWGNNIATRSKIGLYTKGSENATLAKIGPNKFGGSFNSGGINTFGVSNVSSSNNKLLGGYGGGSIINLSNSLSNKNKDINSFGNSYMQSLNSF